MFAQCTCGQVKLEATGEPLSCAVCYCDDCQAGSRQLEALPGAGSLCEADGGTAYVLFRKDRVRMTSGAERLEDHKLGSASATSRTTATCCGSPMMMRFDDARHWVCLYRARVHGEAPPVQMRICTKFRTADAPFPTDVPAHAGYPAGFLGKLLVARVAMLFGR